MITNWSKQDTLELKLYVFTECVTPAYFDGDVESIYIMLQLVYCTNC